MTQDSIYLDYAAATPMDMAVERAMRPYYGSIFGNPSAIHRAGQVASTAVFKARRAIAEALGAHYREIFFTGSATEANNLALRGALVHIFQNQNNSAPTAHRDSLSPRNSADAESELSGLRDVPQNHTPLSPLPYKIIISAIEHESVRETARDLERIYGVEVVEIPVDNLGIIRLDMLKKELDERVLLISVHYVNSEVGTIQPIRKIGEIITSYKLKAKSSIYPLFHTDAVQAFNYLPCNVDTLGVDLLTLSAHKIYGPKGIGALYVRRTTLSPKPYPLNSLITGGGQEDGLRSGTENVPAIVGFAEAVAITEKNRVKESPRVATLRDALWQGIKKIVPDAEINGSTKDRIPNNLNVYFSGRSAQDLVIELDMAGIAVSPGTACSSRAAQPSYVIAALGFSGDRPASSIRFSLGRQTTMQEINRVIALFKKRFS